MSQPTETTPNRTADAPNAVPDKNTSDSIIPGSPPVSPPDSPTSTDTAPSKSDRRLNHAYSNRPGWDPKVGVPTPEPPVPDSHLAKHTRTAVCDEHNRLLSRRMNIVLGDPDPTFIKSPYQSWFDHINPVSSPYRLYFPKAINLKFENSVGRFLESMTILERCPHTHEETTRTYETKVPIRYTRSNPRQPPPHNIPHPLEDLVIDLKTGEYENHLTVKRALSPLVPYTTSSSSLSDGLTFHEEPVPEQASSLSLLRNGPPVPKKRKTA